MTFGVLFAISFGVEEMIPKDIIVFFSFLVVEFNSHAMMHSLSPIKMVIFQF
jgi:hypothetical protein